MNKVDFQQIKRQTNDYSVDIIKDLDRTFPKNPLFSQQGTGQRKLFEVLNATSAHSKEIGYVQGMNFVAGVLVQFLTSEEAF